MKRLLTTLFTLFFSALAFADSGTSIPSAPATDISISLLGQLFGTVGGVLHGTSGDMLGQMFYRFNQGIFVVAGMFVIYTTSTMVLRSATEGSFMGSDKKSGWFTMLRIPLGLALLIPVPSTGYETYQSVVMEAVIQGVNLADSTWSWALSYLNAGGVLYYPPSSAKSDATTNFSNELVLAQNVMANLTCMEISNIINTSNPGPGSDQTYSVQTDNIGFNLIFPGVGNQPGQTIASTLASCGSLSWNPTIQSASVCSPSNTDPNAEVACGLAQAASQQLLVDLQDAAKTYACNANISGNNGSYCQGQPADVDVDQVVATAINNAVIDYQNLMMPLGAQQNKTINDSYTKFISQATNDGWIMAGRYYWDIALLNDNYSSAGALPILASTPILSNPTSPYPSIAAAQTDITASSNQQTNNIAYLATQDFNTFYGNQAGGPNGGGSGGGSGGGGAQGAAAAMLMGMLGPVGQIFQSFNNTPANPILFIHNLGVQLLSTAGDIWIAMSITIFVLYIVGFICSSESPAGQALAGMVDWLKPLLLMIIAMLFGTGVMLAYYVPLYPYIIFTFGTIGWFIAVIEAMVAAPLVCFGLTHPEGHDFLGKAEQALMLLLAVFLRPVLMILGLVSAMILSYVALLLLNIGFGGVITSLYGDQGSDLGSHAVLNAATYVSDKQSQNPAVQLVVVPSLLVIFTMLVYTIMQQCYSLIFVLPENVLMWIGGPKSDSHAGQYAQQIEGAVQSTGKQIGEGVGSSVPSGAGALKGGGDTMAAGKSIAAGDFSGNEAKLDTQGAKDKNLASNIATAMKSNGAAGGGAGGGPIA